MKYDTNSISETIFPQYSRLAPWRNVTCVYIMASGLADRNFTSIDEARFFTAWLVGLDR